VHVREIAFGCLDSRAGEVTCGWIVSTPAAVQDWVGRFGGREVRVAIEACTGWLFVARAVERAGGVSRLAETVETRALRGHKRRANTDRQDARWLRELLAAGRLTESWIAAEHVRQWRSRLHLRKALIDERTQWLLRLRSVLYHHGLSAGAPGEIASPAGRAFLAGVEVRNDTTRTGLGRARHGRHARSADPRDRAFAAAPRAPPSRLPGAHEPVRSRRADRPDVPLRARGRPPHVQLTQGSPIRAFTAPTEPAAWANSPAGSSPLRRALYKAAPTGH
jgi:hypothetical protein